MSKDILARAARLGLAAQNITMDVQRATGLYPALICSVVDDVSALASAPRKWTLDVEQAVANLRRALADRRQKEQRLAAGNLVPHAIGGVRGGINSANKRIALAHAALEEALEEE